MKILVIVDSIDVNDSSGSKVNVAMINNLATLGFEVLVYHYTLKPIALPLAKTFQIKENRASLYFLLSRIVWKIQSTFKVNINRYIESWFGFSFTFFNDIGSISKALRRSHFQADLVITLSKGASFRPHYAMLKLKNWHHKWLAYIHDPFPFHYYPRPYNWIQPGYAQKEIFFQRVSEKAKHIGFPSQLLAEWMSSYFEKFQNKSVIIPHQIEHQNNDNQILPKFYDGSKICFLHAGNLMKQRTPKYLIEAFKKLVADKPSLQKRLQLILVGPSDYHHENILQWTADCENIIYIPQNWPYQEIRALQKVVDVNIILEAVAEISPFLPGKFADCIDANRPILLLGPHYSESKRLLKEETLFWSESHDAENILGQLVKLVEMIENNEKVQYSQALSAYFSVDYLKKQIEYLV